MNVELITYNLWFHKAYPEIKSLCKSYQVDLLFLQECFTNELENSLPHLKLADSCTYALNAPDKQPKERRFATVSSLIGNVGLALYYNPKNLKLNRVSSFQLPLPWHERKAGRTLQTAEFLHKESGAQIAVANLHLSALWSTNTARRKQLLAALEYIRDNYNTGKTIIAGDFNYPFRQSSLQKLMAKHDFQECGSLEPVRTHTSKLLRGKLDRVFISKSLTESGYSILPFGSSDHAPLFTKIRLK